MQLNFKSYAALSLLVTGASVYYAYLTRHQFYPAALFLTTNKLNIVILGNLSFFLLLFFAQCIKTLFLSKLSRDEIEELVQNSKFAITETCLALTIFREELNVRILMLFTVLLFCKIFHWLAGMRVELIARTHGLSVLTHARLVALLTTLLAVDSVINYFLLLNFYYSQQASVLILFTFEFTILVITVLSTTVKYGFYVYDLRRDGQWTGKSTGLFYLELLTDLMKLILYLLFFLLICTYYGLPLHLIRELCVTFYNLRERIVKFVKYRKMTKNMNENFENATVLDLNDTKDKTCIICREEMELNANNPTQNKKLSSCQHCFHFHCLRSWLERSTLCPTCRTPIQLRKPVAQAAESAAAVVLPPLPQHLQAVVDANQRLQQQQQPVNFNAENAPINTTPSPPSQPSAVPAMSPFAHLAPVFSFAAPPASGREDNKESSATASVGTAGSPTSATMAFVPSTLAHLPFAHFPIISQIMSPHPGSAAVSEAASSDNAAMLPALQSHTSLLQSHMDMLESQLRAVRELYERQLELQELLMASGSVTATASASPRSATSDSDFKQC